ncbi:MAG: PKD domain-containing protein, partial [Luminiphilus sp.]
SVQLSSDSIALVSFTAPNEAVESTLIFEVTVSDGALSDSDVVTVVVGANSAPEIAISAPTSVAAGASVVLDASATSDLEDDTLTFSWAQTAGSTVTLSSSTTSSVSFTAPSAADQDTLSFALTVTDGVSSVEDAVTVTVEANVAPAIVISAPSSVAAGASVTLDASESTDPEGDTLSYSWVQTSGPSVTLSSTTTASVTFTAPSSSSPSTVAFALTLSDGVSSVEQAVSVSVAATASSGSGNSGSSGRSSGGSSGVWLLILLGLSFWLRRS